MNRQIGLLSLFFSLIIISACKKIPTATPVGDVDAALDISKLEMDFDYLTTSSKIRFSNDDKNLSANASIRIKKDSIIWISVSPGFGVEAARGMATKDSLIIINRLNKEYMAYDFKKLSEEFNFDITYDLLQSALLGNMPLGLSREDKIKKDDAFYVIKQEAGNITVNNYINARLMKVEKVNMREKNKASGRDNTLNLQYGDFKTLEAHVLPFINLVALNYKKGSNVQNTEINIEHKKATFSREDLNFPFNIPEKYEQK